MDKKVLMIPDTHRPYHHKSAYNLMLEVASNSKIDEIIMLGDYADFYAINSHGKSPEMKMEMKDEIDDVRCGLSQLQSKFPKTKRTFIEGNHEWRLHRYICNKAPEMYNIVDTRTLLDLDKYGFEFAPYTPDQGIKVAHSGLIARHEPISGGVHSAHGTVTKAGCSVIFGHTHRIQESQIVSLDGSNYRGISIGWLGNKYHPVMSYVKNHWQWALGFSVATVLDNGLWFNNTVHIIEKDKSLFCIYEGYKYEISI